MKIDKICKAANALKKYIAIATAISAFWYVNHSYGFEKASLAGSTSPQTNSTKVNEPVSNAKFRCDGRIYCSQMTSCEEARYFIKNCSDTKMDGDHDGIPCEGQWCGNRRN